MENDLGGGRLPDGEPGVESQIGSGLNTEVVSPYWSPPYRSRPYWPLTPQV